LQRAESGCRIGVQTVLRCAAISVAKRCSCLSRFEAACRRRDAPKCPFGSAGFCRVQRSKRQKQQALRRAGGLDELMLKKI
jgi:hypothetical protein